MGLDYKKHIDKFENEALNKYEDEILTEGMIANAKLLSNDKYEFDCLMALFGDRLKIIPNGSSRIGKTIKLKGFRDTYIHKIFPWPITIRGNRNDFKESVEEFSKITTSLFSYQTNDRNYIGLEQVTNGETIGKGLNNMVNSIYTLMAMYSKYYTEATPNDLLYRDIKINMKEDNSLCDIELKSFNLVRLLVVVSDNIPNNNYNEIINKGKSPINSRVYNNAGDNVVLNDLLYAGKYGKASSQYSKIFDCYLGHQGSFENLLRQYDYVIKETELGHNIDKEVVKDMIFKIYTYYGEKYLRMKKDNALNSNSLDRYKERVKEAINSVISDYNLNFSYDDYKYKTFCEDAIELNSDINPGYHKLTKIKETFEPFEKVPIDADNKAREIRLKYKLKG